MESPAFTTVLGQSCVLGDVLGDARNRVLAYDGDVVVGMAAFEPLYGHQAEAAIAVAPGSAGGLVAFLLDGIVEQAAASGVTVLRFVFAAPRQRTCALELTAGRAAVTLRSDRLEIRTGVAMDVGHRSSVVA